MVNAQKHRALLNDYDTKVSKRLNKMLCLSNNARKQDINGDKFILANTGNCRRNEIIKTNKKRNELKRGLIYGFD